MTALRVFILSVVELSGKDQQIALDEYSRLVVPFDPGSTFSSVMRGQSSNFRDIGHFSSYKTISKKQLGFNRIAKLNIACLSPCLVH